MFAAFFIAGMILSGSLAYAGLARGQLKFSAKKTLTGRSARSAGLSCVAIFLVLLGGLVWAILQMVKGG